MAKQFLQHTRASLTGRLYVRIYLALLLSLALATILSAIVAHLHSDPMQLGTSMETFGEIAMEVLPPADAPPEVQQAALARWQMRVHADLALYAPDGRLIAAFGRPLPPLDKNQNSSGWLNGRPPVFALKLPDQRWLLGQRRVSMHKPALGLLAALVLVALAVAFAAYPVVRRMTRRLERLQHSVDALGEGQLSTRVAVEGDDEIASLANSFNRSAARIEALVDAQKSLLANASHELRSPLARLKMAVELLPENTKDTSAIPMRVELSRNIAELDQLIEEILLASQLEAGGAAAIVQQSVDLTAIAAEEAARVQAQLQAEAISMIGDARLIRRMLRNLLENAQRYGRHADDIEPEPIQVILGREGACIRIDVCDKGPGVPDDQRELIFAPFYRLPGTSERTGGVGLGLSLVRQIAERHGGSVQCLLGKDGGSCFRVELPLNSFEDA